VTEYEQVVLFKDYEIRDTLEHFSEVCNWVKPKPLTIWVSNTLDQTVTIQPLGNILPSRIGSVAVGASVDVASNTQTYITLVPVNVGYVPHVLVKASCTTAPTMGKLDAYAWVPIKEQP